MRRPAEGNVGLCSNVYYIERSEPQAVRVERLRARECACVLLQMVDESEGSDCSDSACRFRPPDRPGVAPVTTTTASRRHASASLSIPTPAKPV